MQARARCARSSGPLVLTDENDAADNLYASFTHFAEFSELRTPADARKLACNINTNEAGS
jgi:hypothetical protein